MHQIKKPTIAMSIVAMFIIAPSCSDQELKPQDNEVSDNVKTQFKELGFDISDIRIVNDENPFSSRFGSKYYMLEGDIAITEDNLKSMVGSDVHHVGAVG